VSHLPENAGICASCIHARSVTSDRGSVFLLCELSFTDPRFQKYPKLPLRSCSGHKERLEELPALDWSTGVLAEGLRCYRAGQFFEAHEHWEIEWLKAAEPSKSFLQGLIQVTAAFHHWRRGNREGTASLLRQALRKLELFGDVAEQVMVAPLRADIREWLDALNRPEAPDVKIPEIRIRNG
jgi:uncharacterized protein